jgi:anti-anti-sigma factor
MNIQRVNESTHTVLILEGRLDAPSTPILDQEFQGAFNEGARKFIWDCSGLSYISSAGLRSFLQALKRLNAHGGALIIAAAPPLVVEVLKSPVSNRSLPWRRIEKQRRLN